MTAPSDRAIAQAFFEMTDGGYFSVEGDKVMRRAREIDTQQPQQAEGGYVKCTCGCPNGLKHSALAHADECAATPQPGERVPDAGLLNVAGRQYLYDKASDSYVRNLDGQQPAQGDACKHEWAEGYGRDPYCKHCGEALAAQAGGNGDG